MDENIKQLLTNGKNVINTYGQVKYCLAFIRCDNVGTDHTDKADKINKSQRRYHHPYEFRS